MSLSVHDDIFKNKKIITAITLVIHTQVSKVLIIGP